MTSSTPPTRSRDVDRLLTFVDAIVAIAITLLVLPLVDVAADVGHDESVWRLVRTHSGQFVAFFLSFLVIARLWSAQHRVVRGAVQGNRGLTASLIAWALTIVFLPFPTALLADAGSQVATKVFYIGTLALSSAVLAGVAVIVRTQLPDGASQRPRVAPLLIDVVLFGVALVVCLLAPRLGYSPLVLLLLATPIERMVLGPPSKS